MAAKCYTRQQVMDLLHLKRRSFERLKAAGQLPMVEELRPVISNRKLYRADLLDRYLAGEWGQPRHFASHLKGSARASRSTSTTVAP
jgi:hypothetical protein